MYAALTGRTPPSGGAVPEFGPNPAVYSRWLAVSIGPPCRFKDTRYCLELLWGVSALRLRGPCRPPASVRGRRADPSRMPLLQRRVAGSLRGGPRGVTCLGTISGPGDPSAARRRHRDDTGRGLRQRGQGCRHARCGWSVSPSQATSGQGQRLMLGVREDQNLRPGAVRYSALLQACPPDTRRQSPPGRPTP